MTTVGSSDQQRKTQWMPTRLDTGKYEKGKVHSHSFWKCSENCFCHLTGWWFYVNRCFGANQVAPAPPPWLSRRNLEIEGINNRQEKDLTDNLDPSVSNRAISRNNRCLASNVCLEHEPKRVTGSLKQLNCIDQKVNGKLNSLC